MEIPRDDVWTIAPTYNHVPPDHTYGLSLAF